MVHVYATTLPVPPTITHSQLWKGLALKARDPATFIPAITECTVVEESEDKSHLLRRVRMGGGEPVLEDVWFVEPCWAHFKTRETSSEVINLISTSPDGSLLLTFAFKWRFPGVEEGSEEERRKGEEMAPKAGGPVESTIRAVERLVQEGKL